MKYFGLSAQYDEVQPLPTDHRQCGACGAVIKTLVGAKQVVCETCGYTLDVGSEALPCRKCGALLAFPVSASHLLCPYCQTDNRRV